jgi:hypothetical protein
MPKTSLSPSLFSLQSPGVSSAPSSGDRYVQGSGEANRVEGWGRPTLRFSPAHMLYIENKEKKWKSPTQVSSAPP